MWKLKGEERLSKGHQYDANSQNKKNKREQNPMVRWDDMSSHARCEETGPLHSQILMDKYQHAKKMRV